MCVINLSLLKTLNPVNQPKFVYPNIMYKTFFVMKDTHILFQPPKATPCPSCVKMHTEKIIRN